ncbi:MAG TPA: HYR domain-containing protein, partial [Bacteroidales bacterium]|nr:HYR domain-containing protein [Bacteroidales bacterium]
MRFLFLLVLIFSFTIDISAQTYKINEHNGETIATCSGTFYDSGGNMTYSSNEDYTVTFEAPAGSSFTFTFSVFNVQSFDHLYVYDGSSTSADLIANLTGSAIPPTISSSSNFITFRFVSDASFVRSGWVAGISCISCSALSVPLILPTDAEECEGTTVRYSVDYHAGSTYEWDVLFGDAVVVTPGNGNEVDVTWNVPMETGIIHVKETNPCGAFVTSEAFVDIYPSPNPSIIGSATVCPGATGVVYSTTDVPGNTYNWNVTGGSYLETGSSVTVNWDMTGPGSVEVTETTSLGCSLTTLPYDVVIEDVTVPVVSDCPGTINIDVLPGTCSNTATWTEPTAIDNCSGPLAYTTRSHSPGSSFPTGTTPVTYTFTDAAGNTSTCSFDVVVKDNINPLAVCQPFTVVLDALNQATITPADIDGGSSDNCSGFVLTADITSFDIDDIGDNNVTLTITDASGNTDFCIAVVTVQGNTPPVAICSDYSVYLGAGGTATITGSNIDGGSHDPDGIKSLVASPNTFDCSNLGTNTVTLTVTDNADLTSTCTATVTVIDNIAPSITCPSDITTGTDAGTCEAVVNYVMPTGSDNCSGSVVTQIAGFPSGATFPTGTTINTFRVTDGSGNTTTCSFNVTVNDNVKPVIILPVPPTVNTGAACQAPIPVIATTITDNCTASGSIIVTQLPAAGTLVGTGVTTVTITARDLAGNIQTATIDVTVIDATPPAITAPANITQNLDGSCEALVPDFLAALVVSDNCTAAGSIVKTQTPAAGTAISGVASTNILIEATDAGGNVSSVTVLFITKDVVPPVLSCQDFTLYLNSAGNGTLIPANVIVSATDNCGSLSYSLDRTAFSCADIGTPVNVVLTATDGSLNSTTCTSTITVLDNLPPIVNTKTFNLVLNNATGTGILLPANVDNLSTDNCSLVSLTVSPNTFDCSDVGTQTVTLTATDGSGNTSSKDVDITVSTSLTISSASVSMCDADYLIETRFKANVSGGLGPYEYYWDCVEPVNMFATIIFPVWPWVISSNTSTEETPIFNNLVPDGLYNIELTVTDANGCQAVYNFSFNKTFLSVEDNMSTNNSSACAGQTLSYSIAPGATSYSWDIENGSIISGANTNTVEVEWGSSTPGRLVCEIVKPSGPFLCTSYHIENVTINENPVPAFATAPVPACQNSVVTYTLSSAFSTYGWAVTGGDITAGGTGNPFVTVKWGTGVAGSVTANVTNASGCPGSVTANITLNTPPSATLTSSDADNKFCEGTSVTFTAPAGGTNYKFRIDGLIKQDELSNLFTTDELTNGQIVDVVVSTAAGCIATSSGITNTVVSFPVPTLICSIPTFEFCAGTSVKFTAGGGTFFEFFVDGESKQASGSPEFTTNSLTDGQKVYAIVSNSECSDSSPEIEVHVNTAPVITFTSSHTKFCAGTSVTFTATGGALYDFRVDGSTVQKNSNNIFTTTSLTDGQVVDVVVSDGGCSATSTPITVDVDPLPDPTLTASDNNVCAGTKVIFTATGGTKYDFRVNGSRVQYLTSSIYETTTLTNGQYVDVIVENDDGCKSTSAGITMTITTPPIISINYAGSPYCITTGPGQAVTLSGPSGGTYSASSTNLSINASTGAINPSASTAGTYIVTYTYVVGGDCIPVTATANVEITNLPIAAFSYSGSPYCNTASDPLPTFVSGGVAGTFSSIQAGLVFVNASTGQVDLSASTSGTYDVVNTISAYAGCGIVSASSKITIAGPSSASITYSGTPFCSSDATVKSATLTGTGSYTGGLWSYTGTGTLTLNTSTGDITPSSSSPGTYTITYTLPAGPCTSTPATTTISISTAKEATISYAGQPYCTDDGAVKNVTLTGETGGVFTVTPAGLSINSSTGAIAPSLSLAGNYTVKYTIPAGSGCPAVDVTTPVSISEGPSATISYSGSPYCTSIVGSRAVILTGTGSYTGGTFTYTGSGSLSLNATTGAITPSTSTAGTYTIEYTSLAVGGCTPATASTTIVITAMPDAEIAYADNPYCTTLTTAQPVTLTGTSGGTFSAAPGTLAINPSSGAITPSSSTPANYTVTYTIAASSGCSAFSTTTNVQITQLPTVSISYDGNPFCSTSIPQTVTITGSGDYLGGVFSSESGLVLDGTSGMINPATSSAGNYTVTYDTGPSGGCPSVLATTDVTVNEPLPPSGDGTQTFCAIATPLVNDIEITASGTVTWYNAPLGGSVVAGTTALVNGTTYYASQTISGCESETRLSVTVTLSSITPSVIGDLSVCPDETGVIYSTTNHPGNTYTWSITGGTITLDEGYRVTVTWGGTEMDGNISVSEFEPASGCTGDSPVLSVLINDAIAPVPVLATLPNVTSECSVTSLTAPTATDNCGGTVTASHDAVLPIITQGTTVVTWTYDDGHGNTVTQKQNVIIDDNTAPVITVPAITLTQSCFDAAAVATWAATASATDNCGGTITVTPSYTAPADNCDETIVVTFTATDACGNTSTATKSFTVDDNTAPVITVPATTLTQSCFNAAAVATWAATASATDNCGGTITVTPSYTAPADNCDETIVVTFTATDACGNTSTAT